MGFPEKGTIKLRGEIKGRSIILMINSEATNNFIHRRIVDELNLLVIEGTKFGVTISGGRDI